MFLVVNLNKYFSIFVLLLFIFDIVPEPIESIKSTSLNKLCA